MIFLNIPFFSDIKQEFSGYNAKRLRADILAGTTVAAIALPLAIAFGIGSGADAASGLITAIIAGLFIGGLSGTSYQISGPTSALTAILIGLVGQYQLKGMFIATILAGIILLAAGIFRFGKLVQFIPSPVISGFTTAIAIIIFLSQVENLIGIPSEGQTTVERFLSLFTAEVNVNYTALVMGFFVAAIIFLWPKKLAKYVPGALAAIIISTIAQLIFQFDIKVVGTIPRTLFPVERLTFETLLSANYSEFITPAIGIAALVMIESLLCGVSGGKMTGNPKFSPDQELISQGIGNLIVPFFGGVPASASIVRTSVGIKTGGTTRVVSIVHSIVLLASMFLLAPAMKNIPLAALAGILFVTAYRMIDFPEIKFFFSRKMVAAISKFVVTLIITVVFDLTVAIVAGISFSILLFIKDSTMDITVDSVDPDRLKEKNVDYICADAQIRVVYLSGPLFFGTVEKLKKELFSLSKSDLLIVSMRGVPMIDASGLIGLREIIKHFENEPASLCFAAIQPRAMKNLEQGGVVEMLGKDSFFWSSDKAIAAFNEKNVVKN